MLNKSDSLAAKIKFALIYLGCSLGFILLLENLKLLLVEFEITKAYIFITAVVFWLLGLLLRKVILKKSYSEGIKAISAELIYFLLSLVYVSLFSPVLLGDRVETGGYGSQFYQYFSHTLVFDMFVTFGLIGAFIILMVLASEITSYFILHLRSSVISQKKLNMARLVVFAFYIVSSLLLIQVPGIWAYFLSVEQSVAADLSSGFSWVSNYVFGAPSIYYVYAAFLGSKTAESFRFF